MKVILLDEIKGKGGEGDVVEVAQGYAENFLFPKKLAVAATKGNLKQLDERRNNIAKREAVRLATANETKAAFEGKQVTVDVKVGDEGILFGSVTAAMIADAIKDQLGMDIDRKRVELGKPIKVAGAHTVAISLYREIKAEVVVLVGVTAEDLAPLRAGFRARYIVDAVEKLSSGEVSLDGIKAMDTAAAREELKRIKGVGDKVADCVLLFGYHKTDAFPRDVWIKRIEQKLYPDGLPECIKGNEGIAQQFLFDYARTHEI